MRERREQIREGERRSGAWTGSSREASIHVPTATRGTCLSHVQYRARVWRGAVFVRVSVRVLRSGDASCHDDQYRGEYLVESAVIVFIGR